MLGLLAAGGCPKGGTPIVSTITVRVTNSTDFDVDPAVEFGLSSDLLSALDTGILAPGESFDLIIQCADVAVLTTTGSTQLGFIGGFELDPLPLFRLDQDYFCGELVEFQFVGNGRDFDVQVSANGEVLF